MSKIPQPKTLTKTESLFIRAAHQPNALAMVRRVYRRQYLSSCRRNADFHISRILVSMCRDFMPIDPIMIMDGLNPVNSDYYRLDQNGIIDGHYTKILKLVISHIRYQRVDTLPGFRSPLWVRRQS